MTETRNSGWKITWFFLGKYKPQIAILLVLSLLIGSLEAAVVAAVYPIVSTAFDTGVQHSNFILNTFASFAKLLPIEDTFITYCIVFLLMVILAFVVKIISINFRVRFAAGLIKTTQNDVYKRIINADYQYFIDHKQGELIYNIAGAPAALSVLITAVTELLSHIVLLISVTLLLVSISWQGTIAVVAVGTFYYFFTRYLGKNVSYSASKGEMEAHKTGNVILNESISGIKQLKVFVALDNWVKKYRLVMKDRWYYFVKREIWQQVPAPILMLFLYLAIGIIALVIKVIAPGSFLYLLPAFGTFIFAVFRIIPALSGVGNQTMKLMSSLPNSEIIYAIQNDDLNKIKDGTREFETLKTAISFENVSFTYTEREPTLKNFSLAFEKGKTTAIVGRSGSGKTTVISLLLRLFDPERGRITIDGTDIKEIKLSSWLKEIGLVSQDTFIINDSIRNNITLRIGNYSEDQAVTAAKAADAHSFIMEMPQGYDTVVGDKGMKISGGQAQRIAVARAMITEPDVFIFDEATNNLDNISEAAVQKAIDELSKDHTVIIVAHRLSTIANADKIIMLENGSVTEEGTYQELLDKKGAFWKLSRG